MEAGHLVRRFLGSLWSRPLKPDEASWVKTCLSDPEAELWARMCTADQVHAYGVAQRTVAALDGLATRPVISAALLHDVGKVEAHAGIPLRVIATLVGRVTRPDRWRQWRLQSGVLGRIGKYMTHNEIGSQLLQQAGSDPFTSTWALEHELPSRLWTLPAELTAVLYAADNA